MKLTKPQKLIYNTESFSGGAISVICTSVFLKGKKSDLQLQNAVNELYRINDALRIRIIKNGSECEQYVSEFVEQSFEVLHFNNNEDFYNFADAFAKIPIALTGQLCEIKIVIFPDKYGLLVKIHHIISDAWTVALLATQFNRLLSNEIPPAYSYLDYYETEQNYLNSKRYLKDKDFFLEQFKKCEQLTFISEKKSESTDAKRMTFIIPVQFAQEIRDFAADADCSVLSVWVTALSTCLHHLKAASDRFFIGTTILNRYTEKELNTAGLFMNSIPLLVEAIGENTFRENLKNNEDTLMSVFRHQKYNHEDLLTDVRREYGKQDRLYDVLLSYMNATIDSPESSIESTWHHNGSQNESLHISFDDREKEDIFKIRYDYQTEIFTETDIKNLHNYLCDILHIVFDNPHKKIRDIEILSFEEKNKLLNVFNGTYSDYERDKCIHELFEDQVKRTPDKTALVAVDKTLTYKELNEEANRIAHSLIEKGIGKGDIVGLMLPRKSYLLSALLGILKTGAAYLPIDSELPRERIEYMCKDADAVLVVSDMNIDSLLQSENVCDPCIEMTNNSVCYCIYTSGSTGQPKGVMAMHRNVVNYISKNEYNIAGKIITDDFEAIVSISTCSFDIFVTETVLSLVNGLRTVLADEQECRNQYALNKLLTREKGEFLQTTPTKFKVLTADPAQRGFLKNLKAILLGGEAMEEAYLREIRKLTDAKIYNIYGATEVPIWSMFADTDTFTDAVTIGGPIANTQIHIVDKYMKLVPIGVTGELCIAGDSVSAGYLNRPELTAEKFIDNPFGEGKLYRTGDNAYRREDGNIVFVGRSDFQVKIRGLRIELGEIESAISGTEGINQSVVVVRKDNEDRQIICAFYTGEEKSAKELRRQIGEKLPKYMIPHIFTHLEKMPLTASGKVNRNALPEVDLENIVTETEYIAPVTEKEIVLAECIKDVLGAEKVSVLDNFFDMGGDSLKAIELTAKLEEKGYTVAVKTIFSCKDIRELAKELEEKDADDVFVEYGNVIPATAAQMRVYTAQMLSPGSTMYNVTFAFRMEEVNKEQLEKTINKLIERHESLRTRFENKNGQIVQIIEKEAKITVEDITEENLNSFDSPFELDKAPLVRVGCIENTVVISLHHINTDGESMPVFIREFNELYMERALAKPAVQYGEFAVTDIYTEENEKYWLKVFENKVPTLELPTDYPRGTIQSFRGSNVYEQIDISLQERIEEKCKEKGITPFVYYMACFNILLSKLSGNEDIVTGTPISGRKSRYLDTIGMFVNTIALRSKPEGNKTVAELLAEIRDNAIEAIENQNYPFGELVKKLNVNTSGRNPLFDVMLAYQSEGMTDTSFTEKKIEPVFLTSGASKCDMTFTVYPRKEEVLLSVEYCTDLFREERVLKIVKLYVQLLGLCLDDKQRIRDITVADVNLISEFNSTLHCYDIPEKSTLYSLFEKTAKENSAKICIKTAERKLSFGELIAVAEKTDSKIRDITGDNKSVIAVIAERSSEMYGAIYGIIRGGNAYLPIDPEYPKERIDYILENSKAAAVAVQGKFASLTRNIPCIDITEILNSAEKNQKNIPACSATPEDTAYVIYTSGSTGKPKGAKISHKSAVNRILWMHDKYPLKNDDVILQKTPYTFDVSVWEHFWWGMTGGCLAVSKPGEHFLPAKILEETHKNSVTHLHFVPSVFELFLNYLEAHADELYKFNSVTQVFLSGEALSASLVQRFYKLYDCNNVSLHNLYGPTECSVDVTCYDCRPEDTDPVPIGKPVYNTKMYITDKYMNLVPVGVQGEICIAGVNVGQGYLNNPELTAEKFIDNPFGEGKLYKTGDIGYWREDGNIVFVGRKDSQIKLNGQRIELGEIESVISEVNGILSAAVTVKTANGKDILVAFYSGEETDVSYLKDYCSAKLPAYMVPGAFVHLEELPLNNSGKLDRKALLQAEVELSAEEAFSEPENETEKLICESFSRVLDVKNVGRNSDFFRMGGTSLSMISILSEDIFENVTAAEFIRNSTPAKLARILRKSAEKTLMYLESLVNGDNSDKVLILFPYAGGGAEAFSKLVNDFTSKNKDASVYFVRYLHSFEECEKAADEIINTLGGKDISVYSHCVGAAVALQVIKILEDRNVPVKHYLAGALIPPSKPKVKNIWNKVSDSMLKVILMKAGAPLNNLPENEIADMLKRFREDTDFANASFSQLKGKINVPVSVIISKQDLFTKNYMQTAKLWKHYAENQTAIYFTDSKNHYFQNSSSEKIIAILQKFM